MKEHMLYDLNHMNCLQFEIEYSLLLQVLYSYQLLQLTVPVLRKSGSVMDGSAVKRAVDTMEKNL
jgi:hypothetical protein